MNTGKLYLVTRADLRHGSQAAQLVHGMATFAREYPSTFEAWERTDNVVVCITVPDCAALEELAAKAEELSETSENGLAISRFREPDIEDQLTCIVLEPIGVFQEICKGLPLACR